ncbi:Protein lev-9 like protein [Argiope bruennichi]|uniref:Protein lev-9 like protein n=1 Tax=Argiope bruennichi TaxID=94029 RepID=A0A8T0G1D1_ARGBR|nr:Protein lev-9 like protein [Argiope bruennichi]
MVTKSKEVSLDTRTHIVNLNKSGNSYREIQKMVKFSFTTIGSHQRPIPEYDIDPLLPVDPEGCLRNREEAAARGRQCLRKCASDADCISTRKRCLCDGLCGWSCIRPAMCGVPPQVPHARHNASEKVQEFDVDDVVQYTCFQGYDPQGYPRAKCLFFNGTTQWYGLDLRCIPRSCGDPGEVKNARREGEIFTFTSRVTYHCDPGYELVGRANRYCESKGEWSGVLPSCRPVECPIPRDVPSGRAVYTTTTYQSVARYECLNGYRLVGPEIRVCEANKQWEGEEPYCEEIKCGSPGILHNGYVKGTSTRFGTVIYFSCLENMTFVGQSASTTCQKDGTWSHPVPKCMAPCSVPSIEHGRVTNYAPDAKVPHDKHITVDCIIQYELRYNTTPATCNNAEVSFSTVGLVVSFVLEFYLEYTKRHSRAEPVVSEEPFNSSKIYSSIKQITLHTKPDSNPKGGSFPVKLCRMMQEHCSTSRSINASWYQPTCLFLETVIFKGESPCAICIRELPTKNFITASDSKVESRNLYTNGRSESYNKDNVDKSIHVANKSKILNRKTQNSNGSTSSSRKIDEKLINFSIKELSRSIDKHYPSQINAVNSAVDSSLHKNGSVSQTGRKVFENIQQTKEKISFSESQCDCSKVSSTDEKTLPKQNSTFEDSLFEADVADSAALIQKESVLVKMNLRIKTLESNLSLINRYLQQLSESYRMQVEDMLTMFDGTIKAITMTSAKAAIVVLELHGFFVILEIIIMSTIFSVFFNKFKRDGLA